MRGVPGAVTREPEPWETNAPGAFLSVRQVDVYALGRDRFAIFALPVAPALANHSW